MVIYEAKVWYGKIEIKKIEVVEDIGGQLILKNGYKLSKSIINYTNSFGNGFGYTEDDAISAVKNHILKNIDTCEHNIKLYKEQLDFPITR